MTLYEKLSKINDYSEDQTQCWAIHESAEEKDFKKLLIEDKIASCPVCAYGVYHKALKINFNKSDDQAKWQRLWLRHCISPETNYLFAVLREVRGKNENEVIRVEREGSAKKIVFKSLLDKDGSLAKAIGSEDGIDYYKNVLMKWFLQRYNWKNAFQLLLKKEKLFWPIMIAILVTLFPLLMLLFLTEGNINLKPSLVKHTWLTTDYQIAQVLPREAKSKLGDILAEAIPGIPFYIEIFGVIFLAFIFLLFFIPKYTNFIFPRFLGANFIGLLPLVTQNTTWTFPLRLNWGQIFLLSTLSLLGAFIYLTIECRKTTALRSWKEVILRTLPITFYGLLISLSLSILLCDMMAIHFLEYDKILYSNSYNGLFGLIYPKIVFLFAFFSLLIGIFVQIFWEEKTVTEPL